MAAAPFLTCRLQRKYQPGRQLLQREPTNCPSLPSQLHLYESLGWWRAGAELRKVGLGPCRGSGRSKQ